MFRDRRAGGPEGSREAVVDRAERCDHGEPDAGRQQDGRPPPSRAAKAVGIRHLGESWVERGAGTSPPGRCRRRAIQRGRGVSHPGSAWGVRKRASWQGCLALVGQEIATFSSPWALYRSEPLGIGLNPQTHIAGGFS